MRNLVVVLTAVVLIALFAGCSNTLTGPTNNRTILNTELINYAHQMVIDSTDVSYTIKFDNVYNIVQKDDIYYVTGTCTLVVLTSGNSGQAWNKFTIKKAKYTAGIGVVNDVLGTYSLEVNFLDWNKE